jgi:hypothetical protein
MYTCVPRQIREDMEWMADCGTNAVIIGVLEQDFSAAVENIQLVAAEAARVGMQLFVTPSRWGSLVAGCPKVPSIFCGYNRKAWSLNREGEPHVFLGPVASVHHPDTFEFFTNALNSLFDIAPVGGIVWDEPKALDQKDYSPAAQEALEGKDMEDPKVHIDAQADFFERVNAEVLKNHPDLDISMFLYGHLTGYAVERCAQISNLTTFGLDGRPFRLEDNGSGDSGQERAGKTLCDHGPYFADIARKNNKGLFMLIENHALKRGDIDLMDKRLPEVFAQNPEHLCYYYYPRSVEDPDRAMSVIARHLKKL